MRKIFTLFFVVSVAFLSLFAADLTVTGSFPGNNWVNNAAEYKMNQIGTTNIYTLEKSLVAGSYEFKVFYTGTWNGADGTHNAKITLTSDKTVKFYAKDNGTAINFVCDAQELFVIGSAVGGWDIANAKVMTSTSVDARYTADVVVGDYKIVSKNGTNLVWDYVTPNNQNVGAAGNYTIKIDFETFSVSATNNVDTKLSSLINSKSIYVKNRAIYAQFSGVAHVELYSLAGQLITKSVATNQFVHSVNHGVYLLRINGEAHKVIVQ